MVKALVCLLLAGGAALEAQPTIAGCPVFPSNNIWNVKVDKLPVLGASATYVGSIGTAARLRYDTAIPINTVPGTQPKVAIQVTAAADESDPGPYPIPPDAKLEDSSDAHAVVIDTDNCILYEIFGAVKQQDGSWSTYSAAAYDLRSNALRPDGWTSADAAGLPIAPGLLRYDEAAAGEVKHAIRFTVPKTQKYNYIWPARHYASSSADPALPPMGLRLRLRADFDASGLSAINQTIVKVLKTYGIMIADNGLAWEMQFAQDSRWDNDDLLVLMNAVHGSDFEAVDTSGLKSDPNSGRAVKVPVGIPISITDAIGRNVQEVAQLGPGLSYTDGVLSVTSMPAAQAAAQTAQTRAGNTEGRLTFAAPLVRVGDTVSCPGCAAVSGRVAAARTDGATLGSWKGVYGASGHGIAGERPQFPVYATVKVAGASEQVWAAESADARAVETANGRAAAAWQSPGSFTVDVTMHDAAAHQVALYFVDWDNLGRRQTVEVLDVNNRVIDSRTVEAFGSGKYLLWDVAGHVIFRVSTAVAGVPAVLSGVFFDR